TSGCPAAAGVGTLSIGRTAAVPHPQRSRVGTVAVRVGGSRPVSYRSFKHLLGETSLERKCRFIFGLGILVLVSGSFFWYGQKTESLVRKQTTQTARMLVNPTLLNIHYKSLGNMNFAPILDVLTNDLKPLDDLPNHEAWVLDPYNPKDPKKQPSDEFESVTLARFIKAAQAPVAARKSGHPS